MKTTDAENPKMDYFRYPTNEGRALSQLLRDKGHHDVFHASGVEVGKINANKMARLAKENGITLPQSRITKFINGQLTGEKRSTLEPFAMFIGVSYSDFIAAAYPGTVSTEKKSSVLPVEAIELWEIWKKLHRSQRNLFREMMLDRIESAITYPSLSARDNSEAELKANQLRLERQRRKKGVPGDSKKSG